ncbi:hypothetical protein SAZ10_03640 [Mesorhizobium sp. BAC0120]|uniref:hypothetical protein n=1 Tax=Mesorhizobium sp. BAC0120 TaxID=3090670 RepID=UPI00298CB41A|nr:hypothetical protein [Mesorhizobium sp. BAC0120]MDW6020850.1 hypothetical protein [Mesorhizobium sp. BAC0120]
MILLGVAGVSLALLCASIAQDVRLYVGPEPDLSAKIWMLDVDFERSAFTWVSIISLFVAAVLLFLGAEHAAARRDRFRWHWYALAALFLLASFDEFAGLHEKLSAVLAARMSHSGVLYFAWAAPAGILALIGLASFIPFIRSFPTRLALLMVLSAGLFLGGAVGLEMIGGKIAEVEGVKSLHYRMETNAEEGMELAGTLLFIYVLLAFNEERRFIPG